MSVVVGDGDPGGIGALVSDRTLLRILPAKPEEHVVPASALLRSVQSVQSVAFALGAHHDGVETNSPGKVKEVRQHYQLMVGTPEDGSVMVPLEIHDVRETPRMPIDDEPQVLSETLEFMDAVQRDDRPAAAALLPSPILRRKALRDLRTSFPTASESWSYQLTDGSTTASVDRVFQGIVERWLSSAEDAIEMMVIGHLSRLDFDARTVTIKYPATGRLLKAEYPSELETQLIEARRDLIQLDALVLLDSKGHPGEITELRGLGEIDLTAVHVSTVTYGGIRLTAREPFDIQVTLDAETQQLYEAKYEPLGIDAYGETRDELAEVVQAEIASLWTAFAMEDPGLLTDSAKELADALRHAFEESS